MQTELAFLGILGVIFIACLGALLKKLKNQYKNDRQITGNLDNYFYSNEYMIYYLERVAHVTSLTEVYIDPIYPFDNDEHYGRYPNAPPAYTG